jgi:opacity protein-like surface antigen
MKRSLIVAAVALACICTASSASAQSVNPIKFGVAGGLSMPQGDFGDVSAMGYNITGVLGFQAPMVPVGLRFDLGYNGFGEKDDNGVTASILSGTLNGVFNLGMAPTMSPYLIGGLGMYRSKVEIDGLGEAGEASSTDFGFNGGIGLRFGLSGFSTFAEARYNHIMTDEESTSYIPITFGIMF